jgi:hypothetical protein
MPRDSVRPDVAMDLPDRSSVESFLYENELLAWLGGAVEERQREVEMVKKHVELSLNALIDRQQLQQAEYLNRQIEGQTVPGLDGLIAQADNHLDELNNRLDSRHSELELERHCTISDIKPLGRAFVLPHPDRASESFRTLVRDDEIEKIAIEFVRKHEESQGWVVESVESENRGFDLISRYPHREDPKTFVEVRFIEVKGRAGVGEIALTSNEHSAAERLKNDFWLYVVFKCAANPELHIVQNPARLGWQPITKIEHYHVGASAIVNAANKE